MNAEVQRKLTEAHSGRGVAFQVIRSQRAASSSTRPDATSTAMATASATAMATATTAAADDAAADDAAADDGDHRIDPLPTPPSDLGRSYAARIDSRDGASRKMVWSEARGRYKAEHLELHNVALSYQSALDCADFHDYELLDHSEEHQVVSFRDGERTVRVNVYYATKTVGIALFHPREGRVQLFARNVDLAKLQDILENPVNPRIHAGFRYYVRYPPPSASAESRSSRSSRKPRRSGRGGDGGGRARGGTGDVGDGDAEGGAGRRLLLSSVEHDTLPALDEETALRAQLMVLDTVCVQRGRAAERQSGRAAERQRGRDSEIEQRGRED